jgi:hypothetical protein
VKLVVVGTVAIVNIPLKLESSTPEILTLWPAAKPCMPVVVMVTAFDERIAPLGMLGTRLASLQVPPEAAATLQVTA